MNIDPNEYSVLILELSKHVVEPSKSISWLNGLCNILKQIAPSKDVSILSSIDNFIVSTLKVPESNETFFSSSDKSILFHCEPYGYLKFYLQEENDLNKESFLQSDVFFLFKKAFESRTTLITSDSQKYIESLNKIKRILDSGSKLHHKIRDVSAEIGSVLCASRCQIKVSSFNSASVYNNYVSAEYLSKGVLDAISVIPPYEDEYLKMIRNKDFNTLEISFAPIRETNEIEKLLSIRYAFIQPIVFNEKFLGLISLHQTDYNRKLYDQEKLYLMQASSILSGILNVDSPVKELNRFHENKVLDSEEFLRALSETHLVSKLEQMPFSLVLVDINKLNQINLKMGFVAGNLVISQTSRYLSRLYSDRHIVARYNNDEFIVLFKNTSYSQSMEEINLLRKKLGYVSILGIGPIDYSFSLATFPDHGQSCTELLYVLERSMELAKARGKSSVCSAQEILSSLNGSVDELLTRSIPTVLQSKLSLHTGPEMMKAIDLQIGQDSFKFSPDTLDSIQSLALALDAKDSYTEGHSQRVSEYAYLLAKQIGLDAQEQEWIRLGAVMHDIGKIGVPEHILLKNGKLTEEEFEIMKQHPVIGARILKPIKALEKVSSLVLYHHEYWDGSGYPHGLYKEDIPIGSMIVSIADAYQAMTSDRPYRLGLPKEEAFKRLRMGKEKQWHPDLIEEFISIVL